MQQALTLIFVETKKGADALEIWLSRNGFPAIAIHGDKVQMVSVFWESILPFSPSVLDGGILCLCYIALVTVAVNLALFFLSLL